MKKLFIFGSSNTDMVIKSDHLPLPGETILGGTFLMNAGGKGANQAVAAARMKANVTFIGKKGNDIFGQQAIKQLQQEGINTQYMLTDQTQPSGIALITVDDKGENSIVVAAGANGSLSPADITPSLKDIGPETIVLVQLEIPLPTVEYIITQCSTKGARVVLNPAPATHLQTDIFSHLYLITPNETEIETLTGIKVTNQVTAEQAAKRLHDKGTNVVVTLGAKGVLLYTNEGVAVIPSPQVTAIDTTGAGDVFNGTLCAFLCEGYPLPEAVQLACKAASISVTRMGAQASAPTRKEVLS